MTKIDPAAKFWNRIAGRYARNPVKDQAAYEHKLDRTASYLRADMTVLEIGCGTGSTAMTHASRVAHIDALDFSDRMIAIAREKAGAITNVDFHVAAVEDWPIPETPYDVVMAHSVLHLVSDLDSTLARLRALLKPGGVLVSSTVCLGDMGGVLSRIVPLVGRTGLLPRVSAFTSKELAARISAAGFEVVEDWRPGPDRAIFIVARAV